MREQLATDRVGSPGYRSAHPGYDSSVYAFSDATPSISINIFGSGSATTTQVVRAG